MLFIFLIPQSPFLSWGKIRSVTLEIGQLAHFPPWPSDQSVLVLGCLVCPGSVLTKRKWNREEAVCSAQPLVLHPKLIKLLTYQKRCTLHTLAQVAQSCLTLCDPMDYTIHGILQARILEWVLSLLQQILPTQESNWDLLHCRRILYQLSYQGSSEMCLKP